jgi:hypothetical protein
LTGTNQCPGGDEKQERWDRESDLFRKYSDEEHDRSVLRQKMKGFVHACPRELNEM